PLFMGHPLRIGMMPLMQPLDIERAADAAWPAAEQVALGDWKLRATHGVTRRANSVFTACTRGPSDLDGAIEAAERFYASRGLRAIFHLSPATRPTQLDDI